MEREVAIDALQGEHSLMTSILEDVDVPLTAAVPTCPGWGLERLSDHLAAVYTWAAAIIAAGEGAGPPDRRQLPRRPPDQPVVDWLRERFAVLITELSVVPADALRWNFLAAGDTPVSFWWRRQLHETLIHRVDVELAAGRPVSAADSGLAADGVAEYLDMASYTPVEWSEIDLGGGMTIHLHATDAGPDAEWTVDTANRTYAEAHLKADVAVRGPAWALDRWCWQRASLEGPTSLVATEDVEAFGDAHAADSWRESL